MANELANSFANNSSNSNYSPEFLEYKNNFEKENSIHITDSTEDINNPLLLDELKSVLSETKNSSAGPDNIPNIMLKHLPENGLVYILSLFNTICSTKPSPQSGQRRSSYR